MASKTVASLLNGHRDRRSRLGPEGKELWRSISPSDDKNDSRRCFARCWLWEVLHRRCTLVLFSAPAASMAEDGRTCELQFDGTFLHLGQLPSPFLNRAEMSFADQVSGSRSCSETQALSLPWLLQPSCRSHQQEEDRSERTKIFIPQLPRR